LGVEFLLEKIETNLLALNETDDRCQRVANDCLATDGKNVLKKDLNSLRFRSHMWTTRCSHDVTLNKFFWEEKQKKVEKGTQPSGGTADAWRVTCDI
jgi:hypothetical protein